MMNKCIRQIGKRNNGDYRLFCIPYAGSGASLFSQWDKYVDDNIEVYAIQLPGRENRRNEDLCSEYHAIVSEICDGLADLLDKPFGIFGYSMGGILAYELTKMIYDRFHVKPQKLFMSAASTFRVNNEPEVSSMNEKQLISYMSRTGGVPKIILEDQSLRQKYFPIIQNDYALLENYKFDYQKVNCDIVAFASKDDTEVPYDTIKLMKFFTPNFELKSMSGNHFFIRNESVKIGKIISSELEVG